MEMGQKLLIPLHCRMTFPQALRQFVTCFTHQNDDTLPKFTEDKKYVNLLVCIFRNIFKFASFVLEMKRWIRMRKHSMIFAQPINF